MPWRSSARNSLSREWTAKSPLLALLRLEVVQSQLAGALPFQCPAPQQRRLIDAESLVRWRNLLASGGLRGFESRQFHADSQMRLCAILQESYSRLPLSVTHH